MVGSFLQSPESNFTLEKEAALYDQGLATVACLLSGFKVFARSFSAQERLLRVVSGLHAFHTYATEHWLEYLLSNASSFKGMDTNSEFIVLSSELAKALKELAVPPGSGRDDHRSLKLDDRLDNLQYDNDLYEATRILLLERRLRNQAMPVPDNGK